MSIVFLYRSVNVRSIVRTLADGIGAGACIVKDDEFTPTGPHIAVRWNTKRITTGLRECNTRDAVVRTNDKRAARQALQGLAPRTVYRVEDLFFPCIIRPHHHFGGKDFHVCRTRAEAMRVIDRMRARRKPWYASEIVPKTAEYRVFVLQNRVVAVTQKFAPPSGELMWNFAQGGTADHVVREEWPVPVCVAALRAATALGLDFAAIDIGVAGGRPYVFEGNTAPGVKKKYTVGRIVKAFQWMNTHPERLPNVAILPQLGWKDLIHPGLIR